MLAVLPLGSSFRSGLAFPAAFGDELLVHPIELRFRLGWEAPQSFGSEKVHVTVIPVLDGDDGDDLDRFDTGFFENLVHETVRSATARGAEVDLAAVGQIAVRRE